MNHNDIARFREGYQLLCALTGQPAGTDPKLCAELLKRGIMALNQEANRAKLYERVLFGYAWDWGMMAGALHDNPPRLEDAQVKAALPVLEFSHEDITQELQSDEKKAQDEKAKVVVPERKLVVVH